MTDRDLDAAIACIANAQAGAFSWEQAEQQGATDRQRHRRLDSGVWRRPATGAVGVYLQAGYPRTWWQDVWVGRLALGGEAALSHESAGTAHGWHSFPEGPPVFIVPHGSHPRVPGVVVHAVDDLWWNPDWIVDMGGMPVTSALRTPIDLAATSSKQRVLHVVQNILPPDAETYDALGEVLRTLARRGKPGVAKMGWALGKRAGKLPSTSELERHLHEILQRPGMPAFIPQMDFPGRVPDLRRVDAGMPDVMLIVEADSRTWHQRIAQIKTDRERDSEAHQFGWLVERPMWEHIVGDPDGTAARILAICEVRRRQLAA